MIEQLLVAVISALMAVFCVVIGLYLGHKTSPQPRRRERKPKPPAV